MIIDSSLLFNDDNNKQTLSWVVRSRRILKWKFDLILLRIRTVLFTIFASPSVLPSAVRSVKKGSVQNPFFRVPLDCLLLKQWIFFFFFFFPASFWLIPTHLSLSILSLVLEPRSFSELLKDSFLSHLDLSSNLFKLWSLFFHPIPHYQSYFCSTHSLCSPSLAVWNWSSRIQFPHFFPSTLFVLRIIRQERREREWKSSSFAGMKPETFLHSSVSLGIQKKWKGIWFHKILGWNKI